MRKPTRDTVINIHYFQPSDDRKKFEITLNKFLNGFTKYYVLLTLLPSYSNQNYSSDQVLYRTYCLFSPHNSTDQKKVSVLYRTLPYFTVLYRTWCVVCHTFTVLSTTRSNLLCKCSSNVTIVLLPYFEVHLQYSYTEYWAWSWIKIK